MLPVMRNVLLNSGIVKNGLVAWYKFNDQGQVLTDYSGYNINGTNGTDPGADTNDATPGATGWTFGGLDDAVSMGTPAGLNALTGRFTIQAVVYPTGAGGNSQGRIFDKAKIVLRNFDAASQTIYASVTVGTVTKSVTGTANLMAYNSYHVVGMVYNQINVVGWVNRTKITGDAETGNLDSHSLNAGFVGNASSLARGWAGDLNYLLFYNRDLSNAEWVKNCKALKRLMAKRGVSLNV